jgi:hypothetical protein
MLHVNSPPSTAYVFLSGLCHYAESGNRILIHATAALIQLPNKLLRTCLKSAFYHKTAGMQYQKYYNLPPATFDKVSQVRYNPPRSKEGAMIYLDPINGEFFSTQSLSCGFASPCTGAPVAWRVLPV